jgi:hypothetical protein
VGPIRIPTSKEAQRPGASDNPLMNEQYEAQRRKELDLRPLHIDQILGSKTQNRTFA